MRALVDTNVLLDTILQREPYCKDSDRIIDLVSEGKIEGCVSVQSLKDIFYFCKKTNAFGNRFNAIEKLSFIFEVIDVSGQDSISALMSEIDDYEDGLLLFSAQRNNIKAIITRNERDFYESDIVLINPKDIDRYFSPFIEVGSLTIDNVFIHQN